MESDQTSKKTIGQLGATVLYAVYYLMLLGMLVASFYPAYRVWGFNHWAYYPSYVAIALFCVGALLPFALSRFRFIRGVEDSEEGERKSKFLTVAAILIIVYVAMFYLLRAKTHFLGDGYLLLNNLASDVPIIKLRNYGVTLMLLLVYSLAGGESYEHSLLAYQIVSWLGGLAFVVTTLLFARSLFRATTDRILFALGMLSGGYMLLFFGYAEHYSLFVVSVAWFALTGLLIARGKIYRRYILPPLIIAIFLHIFGLFLLPAAAYLLMVDTKISDLWMRLKPGAKLALVLVAGALSAVILYRMYTTDYFFRFAFVPIVEDKFTLEGYTMFSWAHLSDIGNLVVVLFPGVVVAAATLFFLPVRKIFRAREHLFLLVLLLSCLSAVLMFDPKLGMPRDWDLFSFCGVPLVVWGYYVAIQNRSVSDLLSKVVILAIFLGLVVLIPRAVGRTGGDIELSHAKDYARLDVKKSNYLSWLIRDHYFQRGDTDLAKSTHEQWLRDFPEHEFNRQGVRARDGGRFHEAIGYFRSAIEANPMHARAYHSLGACYTQVGNYDSAMAVFRIADGINPHFTPALIELARLYRLRSQMDKSEEYFNRALEIEPQNMDAYLGLLELYWTSNQVDKHDELLIEVATHPGAPPSIHKRLGDHHFSQGEYDLAEKQYLMAIDKGMNPLQLGEMLDRIRDLQK